MLCALPGNAHRTSLSYTEVGAHANEDVSEYMQPPKDASSVLGVRDSTTKRTQSLPPQGLTFWWGAVLRKQTIHMI